MQTQRLTMETQADRERRRPWLTGDERPSFAESLPLGTETPFGTIAARGIRDGERYYMLMSKDGVVSLMPAEVVEKHV